MAARETGAGVRGSEPPARPAGLPARELAVELVAGVIDKGRTLDEAIAGSASRSDYRELPASDRGLARLIAATVLRRHGQLSEIVGAFIERPLPRQRGRLTPILLAGAAQLVFLGVAPHAVINLAVEQVRRDPRARRFDRLTNAVLRRVSERGAGIAASQDAAKLNIPAWLWSRWASAYGEEAARRIAEASLGEAPLDVSVRSDAEGWRERLGGTLLPTGSIRLSPGGRVETLPGFEKGAWWVQDAAAALPARLFGAVDGLRVADLCAAPGGKTAELAAGGARVTAVDIDARRIERLKANLARLRLEAEVVEADAARWGAEASFDCVLIDAPCLSTGTIRRHPDILHLKRESDIGRLGALQERLLDNAARLVRPGGLLVYCTCSLEPEEGQHQIERLLGATANGYERVAIRPGESGIGPEWITPAGDLRTFPFHLALENEELSGMDGFFAARLRRRPAVSGTVQTASAIGAPIHASPGN
ncbi:MAG: methyltransferase domain-containing protein [Hyphomicrobiaceae bacterium]|nr:methyltransferase domain-containing protein [Hyphomicrobiaceae bacterium]